METYIQIKEKLARKTREAVPLTARSTSLSFGASARSDGRRSIATIVVAESDSESNSDPDADKDQSTRRERVAAVCGLIVAAMAVSILVAVKYGGQSGTWREVRNKVEEGSFWPFSLGSRDAVHEVVVPKTTYIDGRRGSFLVLGDWGWDDLAHGNVESKQCQTAIADAMNETFRNLGDVKFVINVGDSFYPGGVIDKKDKQWDTKWRDIYDAKLRSVPWYSVYGNHDYHDDPCACSSDPKDCAQVHDDHEDLNYFYMPDTSWFKQLPDLGIEIVGLDLNKWMYSWHENAIPANRGMEDCSWHVKCKEECINVTAKRGDQAMDLFHKRIGNSDYDNLLVFSHYPTDYFADAPSFLDALKTDKKKVHYFGGHRHNTDNTSTFDISPNVNWLVGGGGGWSCDPNGDWAGCKQGFMVGRIDMDGSISVYPVIIDPSLCCKLHYTPRRRRRRRYVWQDPNWRQ